MQPVKVATKMLYETMVAVSRFARFPLFVLLVAHSIAAHMPCSRSCQDTCFAFFPVDFRGKEREFTVNQHSYHKPVIFLRCESNV